MFYYKIIIKILSLLLYHKLICNYSGQPQGIAPTSEDFRQCRGNPLWLPCVRAILYGCPV
ncbi:MAG: hypothetical protein KAI83_08070 [Thiomargarita sp.]|nr:hypothetical protein [Thiomargarita sp.]